MDTSAEIESRHKRFYHRVTGSIVLALCSTLVLFVVAFLRTH